MTATTAVHCLTSTTFIVTGTRQDKLMALTGSSRSGKLMLGPPVEAPILLLHLLHAGVVRVEAEGGGRGPTSAPC